jgi:hypothetical protein
MMRARDRPGRSWSGGMGGEGWVYERIHGALGYLGPVEFEAEAGRNHATDPMCEL